jgi:hypothetical protein
MDPVEAALAVAALMLPLHLLIQRQLLRHCDPRYIRSCGVVIRSEQVLERRSGVIGYFAGREIYASVVFMGMEYRFDRVTGPAYRRSVHERELYLEPGLLYLTD